MNHHDVSYVYLPPKSSHQSTSFSYCFIQICRVWQDASVGKSGKVTKGCLSVASSRITEPPPLPQRPKAGVE